MGTTLREEIACVASIREHERMVSLITERLAYELWGDDEKAKTLRHAARLHDIGKNFIPMELLSKPDKLTDAEFAVMKTHSRKGYDYLIEQIKILLCAAIMALQHHERVDGNGYNKVRRPHEFAKLIAVADVFDALVSQRSYKTPWPPNEVISYMQSEVGGHFEATYIDALLSSFGDVMALYDDTCGKESA